MDWARRRYQMGLGGFGMPWEEGEDAWLMLKRPDLEDMTKTSDGGDPDCGDDVAPELLADHDSKFVDLGGIKVRPCACGWGAPAGSFRCWAAAGVLGGGAGDAWALRAFAAWESGKCLAAA